MDAKTIRNTFLEFFKSKEHEIVPSAPLVNKSDPTLMFTNAGMNQFKDYFLGNQSPKFKRIVDTQKCLRVSGKHNDLEEVGLDTYHHTMFEMLGNWSFGDYFKKEAIAWAWELLTEVYGLPKDRIYVTVFGGDEKESLEVDQEAYNYWKEIIAEGRILHGSKKDNFWEMGDTGPCGPCSEIHIDLRPDDERKAVGGDTLVNQDHPLVVEVWNLVFIQFNRLASGALESLPEKHVDTGMGFERLCMAIQGKHSNYDTDVFRPLIDLITENAGVTYGKDEKVDIAARVIADHIRAIAFAITDGQLPSNTGAGYVIRRILRRAVRYGFTFLSFKDPFLYQLVPLLCTQFAETFPEIKEQQDFVSRVVKEEEQAFLKTLEMGLKRLAQIRKTLPKGRKEIDGATAFELYDTYGFPLDLTSLITREHGLTVDEKGFAIEMEKQKDRSKADAAKETGDWIMVQEEDTAQASLFVGYDTLESTSQLIKYRKIRQKNKEVYQLVLDQTPFYAESGGQIGDSGYLEQAGEKIPIIDTQKENELIVHISPQLPKNPESTFRSVVNAQKRQLTMGNHSATHLLHAALREVLGDHVEQKGSLVSDKVLRFDFSHFTKMTPEEVQKVEQHVNEKIRENIVLQEMRTVPIEEAKAMGAMALFGEKYGDEVRVIIFDKDYSIELCGGTHVPATGNIGFFKIISEGSVAAGVRRIEAITAEAAERYVEQEEQVLNEVRAILRNPKDLPQAVQTLFREKQQLEKEIEKIYQQQASGLSNDLIKKIHQLDGKNVIIEQVSLPNGDALKKIVFELKQQVENLFAVLAADINGKPQIAVMISDGLVQEGRLNAGDIVRELAKEIKGGGGGQPFYATAGGKDLSGLNNVVEKAKAILG